MLTEPLSGEQISALGVLALASVGDSVFDLMVRAHLCAGGTSRADDLHRKRVEFVNARAQAKAVQLLTPLFSAEEADIFRRGRNAQPGTIPPAASRAEYQAATALETLFGWLYLRGSYSRLKEFFEVIINAAA